MKKILFVITILVSINATAQLSSNQKKQVTTMIATAITTQKKTFDAQTLVLTKRLEAAELNVKVLTDSLSHLRSRLAGTWAWVSNVNTMVYTSAAKAQIDSAKFDLKLKAIEIIANEKTILKPMNGKTSLIRNPDGSVSIDLAPTLINSLKAGNLL